MSDPIDRRLMLGAAGLLGAAALSRVVSAGPLNPPAGPVTPTGKTLTDIEPRIAINDVNTPGDAASTFRITQPGSYYLTGNLTGESGKHGIDILTGGVTLDLMGFELKGVPGSHNGVRVLGVFSSIAVRNGAIHGWGQSGIEASNATNMCCDGIMARGNGLFGISIGSGGVISDCAASGNTSTGISTSAGAAILNCSAQNNAGRGVFASDGSVLLNVSAQSNTNEGIGVGSRSIVTNCSAFGSGLRGIGANDGCTITDCTVSNSGAVGIRVFNDCTISGCTSLNNTTHGIDGGNGTIISNCTTRKNGLHGIRATSECTIRACASSGNGIGGDGAGIAVEGSDNRIEDNNCTGSDWGIRVTGAGNFIMRNTCSGNTTANWSVVASNKCLVVNGANAAAITGDSGGVSPGSTDPNANFTY